MATTSIGFRWLDILEKDFDKACVELDTSLLDAEPEEPEVVCAARQKISTLSSCFSQLTHKALTIFQHSAKLEAELVDMRAELVQTRAALAKATESQLSSDFSGISEALRTRAEAAQFAKENAVLRETVLALHSELFGARLATKYLDKELAGRIQQLQLLGRNMRADIRDSLWAQVEAEILLQRHKSLVRVCRGTAPPPRARPVPSAPRSVTVRRAQQLGLGISVTGGREHGVPILISELEADGPAALTGELYVGDAILAINELDLTQACHKDAVKALQSVKGDCALCVQFIATDDDEKLSEDNYRFPLYPSEDEAGSRALDGGGATPTAPRTPDYTRRRRPSDEDSVTDYDLHYADYNALNNNLNIVEMDDHRIEVETDLQTIPSKPYDDVRHVTNNAYDNRPIIDHSWHDELQRYAADHSRALSEAQRAVIEPQRSVLEPQRSVIEPQRSGMELQRSVIEPQRSVLEPQRSVIEPQRSGMELQRSFIEPQRSGMEPQRSVIEPQRSVTEPQRSFIEPQRPVLEQQQPVSELQRRYIEPQRATEAQRSYLDLQRSVIEYQRHIINQQRPIIDQQRHIMEQQRPVLEQQNSLTDTQRNITETQNSDMEPQRLVKDKKYPSVDTERSVMEQVRYYKDTSRSLLEPRVLNTPYAPIYRYQSSSASPPSTPVHEPRNIKKKKVKSHDWRSKGAYRAIEDDSSDETPKSPQKPVNGGHSVLPATDETAQTNPIETLIDAPNEPLISLQTEAPRPIPPLPPPNEVNPSINRNKIVLPNNPIQAKLVKNKGFRIGSAKRISEPPLTNGNSNASNGVKENYPNQIVTGDGDPDFGTPV